MKFLLLIFGLFCLSTAEHYQVLKEYSTGYDSFTADVYKEQLKTSKGNFIVCPLSAEIVLALSNAGARGQTAKELSAALRLPEDLEKVKEIFRTVSPQLQSSDSYNLSSANKIYVTDKDGFQISDQFKDVGVNVFDAEVQNVDFVKNQEAAAEINQWVQDKTHDKIKKLIDPSLLDATTRMVLVNAIYFQGNWEKEFKAHNTFKRPFYLNKSFKTAVQTDMMAQTRYFDYYENSEVKVLKMDYVGGEVSMHIVLPHDVEGLAAVEENLEEMLAPPQYTHENVEVMLPKFKIESEIKFKPILQAMGVVSAFTDAADFSGIGAKKEELKISEVVQKAFIEVEEGGTVAAAATGVIHVIKTTVLGEQKEPKVFHADHPFLFCLRLNKLGINFFVGRYTSPSS